MVPTMLKYEYNDVTKFYNEIDNLKEYDRKHEKSNSVLRDDDIGDDDQCSR